MTDDNDPRLELLDDDEEPPPTSSQQAWLREAMRSEMTSQFKPILDTWDRRAADMLDVLKEAADTKAQVRSATTTIKVTGWLAVAVLVIATASLWLVLERERADRRDFREAEAMRRIEAAQLVIEAGREDVRRINDLVREACPVKPAPRH